MDILIGIYMELANNRRENVPTRYHIPPSKTSGSKNGLYFVGSFIGQRSPMETSNHHRLLPGLLVTLCNLMVRPYCRRQYLSPSFNMENWSWCLSRSFYWKVLCIYWRRKVIITITNLQSLQATTATCLKIFSCNSGTNVMGVTSHFFFFYWI